LIFVFRFLKLELWKPLLLVGFLNVEVGRLGNTRLGDVALEPPPSGVADLGGIDGIGFFSGHGWQHEEYAASIEGKSRATVSAEFRIFILNNH
jgi:hypothetical protein